MTCSMAFLALDTTLLITMACLDSHEAKKNSSKKNEYLGVWLSGRSTSVWKVLVPPPAPQVKKRYKDK